MTVAPQSDCGAMAVSIRTSGIAWTISDLITGEVPTWYAALLFILLSGVRAGLDWRAEAAAQVAFLSSTVLELMAAGGVALVAVQMGVSLLGLVSWGGWGGQINAFGAIFVLLIVPDFYQPMRDLAASWHDRAAAMAVLDEARAALAQEGPRILGEGAAPAARCDRPLPLSWRGLVISPGQGAAIAVPDGCLLPRTATAVTGPSGIGKTTFLGTLAGLHPALSGTIRYGDIRLSDATAAGLRGAIGWLPQQPRFPAMSLRRWLRLAAPDATDDALIEALHRACAGHVLAALPQGLGTRLGETGGGVSGGEARRLMIARALFAPPALLLADEPTADLDATSAQEITGALLALRGSGTALLIATHDARLIGAMDHVIALRAGREAA